MRVLFGLSILIVSFFVGGCASGGGTHGTGDVGLIAAKIHGRIQDPAGLPIADLNLESIEFGEMTKTDANGEYSLVLKIGQSGTALEISDEFGASTIELDLNPEEHPDYFLDLEYNSATNSIRLLRLEPGSD